MALYPKQMSQAIIRNLPEKTGASLDDWLDILEAENLNEKSDIIHFLKNEKKLGHFQAKVVLEEFKNHFSLIESETILLEQSKPRLKDALLGFDFNKIRIVRVKGSFEEKDWCSKNHFVYVVKGQIKIKFDSHIKSFTEGNSFSITKGEFSKHKLMIADKVNVELLVFEKE
jgi:hypothetical protein